MEAFQLYLVQVCLQFKPSLMFVQNSDECEGFSLPNVGYIVLEINFKWHSDAPFLIILPCLTPNNFT